MRSLLAGGFVWSILPWDSGSCSAGIYFLFSTASTASTCSSAASAANDVPPSPSAAHAPICNFQSCAGRQGLPRCSAVGNFDNSNATSLSTGFGRSC